MISIIPEKSIIRIFIGLTTLLLLTIMVSEASPIRRNNNTQVPVSGADIREFKLWVKYASAAYCNVTDWNCGKACLGETAGTRLIKFFSNTKPRDNNGF